MPLNNEMLSNDDIAAEVAAKRMIWVSSAVNGLRVATRNLWNQTIRNKGTLSSDLKLCRYDEMLAHRIVFPPYRLAVIDQAPYLHYPLDETAGTVAEDISGNARHGTLTAPNANVTFGRPEVVPALVSYAGASSIKIDGSSYPVASFPSIPSTTEFTVLLWARYVNVFNNTYHLAELNGNSKFELRWASSSGTSTKLNCSFGGGYINSATFDVANGQSLFIAAVFQNDTLYLYRDGTLMGSDTTSVGAYISGTGYVGSPVRSGSAEFSEYTFFRRALTAAEISSLYSVGQGAAYP